MNNKHQDLVDYWELKKYEGDMGTDWDEAHKRCWRCGHDSSRLERCHIIPKSLGGSNKPENLVLLCNPCHKEAPDVTNKDSMWDWIKRTKSFCYEAYETKRIIQEFKNIFGEDELHRTIKKLDKHGVDNIDLSGMEMDMGIHGGELKYSTRCYALKNYADSI
jgi:hypothetical protein